MSTKQKNEKNSSVKILVVFILWAVLLNLDLACSRAKTENQTTQLPQPETKVEAPAKITEAAELPKTYSSLPSLLIEVPGYSADEPQEMRIKLAGLDTYNVVRIYKSGDKEISSGIMVGNPAMSLAAAMAEGESVENADSKIEIKTIDGFKVHISYIKADNSGAIMVFLKEDPIKSIVFATTFQGMPLDEVMAFVKKFNWNAMKQKALAL